jgi:hypothetical protein
MVRKLKVPVERQASVYCEKIHKRRGVEIRIESVRLSDDTELREDLDETGQGNLAYFRVGE